MGGRIYITAWLKGVAVGHWYFSVEEAKKVDALIEGIKKKSMWYECNMISRVETFESEPFHDGVHDYPVKEVWKETTTSFRVNDDSWTTFKARDLLPDELKDLVERP